MARTDEFQIIPPGGLSDPLAAFANVEATMLTSWAAGDRIVQIEMIHEQSGVFKFQVLYNPAVAVPDDGTTTNAVRIYGAAAGVTARRKYRLSTGVGPFDESTLDLSNWNAYVRNMRGGPTGTTDARTMTIYELEVSLNPAGP